MSENKVKCNMSTITEEKMVISEIENWHVEQHHYCVSFFINRETEMNDMLMELHRVHSFPRPYFLAVFVKKSR